MFHFLPETRNLAVYRNGIKSTKGNDMTQNNNLNTITADGELLRINGVLLNYHQTIEFIKLRDRVNDSINELDNKIKAVEAIRYVPKKDGTERAVFVTNFEFEGLGGTYQGYKGPNRYVTISFDRSCWGIIYGITISTAYVEDKFQNTTQTIYLTQFGDEIREKYSDKKEIPAKDVYEIISGPYLEQLRKKRESYREELRMLPQLFLDYLVDIANKMARARRSVSDFDHVYNAIGDLFGRYWSSFVSNDEK